MAMQPLALEAGSGDGSSHSSSRARFRAALGLVLAAVTLVVTGDRSRAATVPAAVFGQDPLEVLELKVRPNVIVVLDSSGSMTEIVENDNNTTASGDHPRSRLAQAKRVMRQVVQNNQNKVSFQMGTYTQNSVTLRNLAAGNHRFQYVASGATFPFMDVAGTELTVQGADGDTMGRGLQSWQIIHPQWNTLYYEETGAGVCTAPVPGAPRFFGQGSALATVLTTAMNGATCTLGARANTYTVTYGVGTGRFSFAATGPVQFRLRNNVTPNSIHNALGGVSTAFATAGTTITLTPAQITSAQRQAGNTRVITPAANGIAIGDACTVSGFVIAAFNGARTVTAIDSATSFRLNNPTGANLFATTIGTIVCTRTAATVQSNAPYTLLHRTTGTGNSGTGLGNVADWKWTFTENIAGTATRFYNMRAGRLWNGEVIRVTPTGGVCGMDFATAATKTNPASIQVVATDATCNPTGNVATFEWGGGDYSGASGSCNGFRSKSQIVPCDLPPPPAQPTQVAMISPYLEDELPLDASGDPADWNGDGTRDYIESQDGAWSVTTINEAPSAKADGSTPIGNSLIDIRGAANAADTSCITTAESVFPGLDLNDIAPATGACTERGFTRLWNTGIATGPWAAVPAAQRAIRNHANPKEKTIVLFVTDGEDTCGTRTGTTGSGSYSGSNPTSRRAALYAQQLYTRIDPLEPASSVQTYVIGFGPTIPGLDFIAWGGSGLGQGLPDQPAVNWQTDSDATLANQRARCTTCVDAFTAPDATTLATQLQAIIDQGASDGEFNAQQSITESVFEYVHLAADATNLYDAAKPGLRYKAIVPTRFVSFFSLPGFRGQQRAYHNDGTAVAAQAWSAGDALLTGTAGRPGIAPSMTTTCTPVAGAGNLTGECVFQQLHAGANDTNIRTSTATIKRRIYTTNRNGIFPYTVGTLIDGTVTNGGTTARVALWPPTAPGLLHTTLTDNATKGYDVALGLPPDSPTTFPPTPIDPRCDPNDLRPIALPKKAFDECWYGWLQKKLGACAGNNLQAQCSPPSTYAVRMQAARRESREIAIAFLAGATTIPTTVGTGIKRSTGPIASQPVGSLLFRARSWILADSELATAAVITPPLPTEPEATPYLAEYQVFRDGPRTGSTNSERASGAPVQVKMGFGLRSPDDDGTVTAAAVDTNAGLKPVMTVLYAPANDMLHAFRSGPCDTPGLAVPCNETGGEELWGFVPFDQLHTVLLRPVHEPQGKANHVYSIARGVRFSDVFIPGAFSRSIGTATVASTQGIWRRVMFFGRGIGGKYMTALDVTGPGAYTENSLDTRPPEPLWSRGNPDTQNGLPGGTDNGTAADRTVYTTMGETWSIPTVAYVDRTNPIYLGKDYVLFMGSGYGAVGEGTTFYTLDALTGGVIAAADVGSRSGFTAYRNALVANAVGFNPKVFSPLTTVHPAASQVTRVYIGDVHGRLWKFLTARPDVALPVADLGSDQAIGTAASLLGLPPQPGTPVPYIYVSAGAELRSAGPFQIFGFRDDGTDTDTAIGPGSTAGTVTTFLPSVQLFSRFFDQGTPDANCGLTQEAVFRGTVQPATAIECSGITVGACTPPVIGRVFFAGTRLSLPNTKFAPVTPLACGTGTYPCRSQFDSIIYAVGAETGLAAYDLNSAGDDAYRIFRDSRIAAITMQADPDPGRGGSSFTPDEGLMKGTPAPPPPPGVPPTATTATANVILAREPGQPAPAIRYGSSVCQE
jgi:hypothetical protein